MSDHYIPTEPARQREDDRNEHALGSVLFDHFVVFGIRHGGQGVVYFVEEAHSHNRYAVKTLPASSPNQMEKVSGRIVEELAALTRVPYHSHVIAPILTEFHNGKPYIFMDYVPVSLRERIGKLSFEEALLFAYQICLAMDFLHNIRASILVLEHPVRCTHTERGFRFPEEWRNDTYRIFADEAGYTNIPGRLTILHGDLKPENVLVTEGQVAKVADFGLARMFAFERGSFIRQSAGTVPYMSPEQLREEPIDERADVFSFGVVFYEMLTGVLPYPFDVSGHDRLYWRELFNDFYSKNNFRSDVTPPWNGIKDPSKYQYINDLVYSCLFPAADFRTPNFHTIRRKLEWLGLNPQEHSSNEANEKPRDHYRRATLLHRMGKRRESLDLLNSVLIDAPNDSQIWKDAAILLGELGESDLAKTLLSRPNGATL